MKKSIFIFILLLLFSISGFSQCWQSISSGDNHSIAIKTNGTLWSWGSNGFGSLGTGVPNSYTPLQIGTDRDWKFISAGLLQNLAIKNDGTLWGWGYNGKGQLGDGTNVNRTSPIRIGSDSDWEFVSTTGSGHSAGIKTDGTLWTWGENIVGTLGNGNNTNTNAPGKVGTETDWKEVYTGNTYTIALKTDGTIWTWGNNNDGQLGVGNSVSSSNKPLKVGTANNWVKISGGWGQGYAINTAGQLWAWGYNGLGSLGDGTKITRFTPIRIGTDSDWEAISSFEYHCIGIKTNGKIWTWGFNFYGQLGDSTKLDKTIPTLIKDNNWKIISAGRSHSAAINNLGDLWDWGSNINGQLGNGTSGNTFIAPVTIACPTTVGIFSNSVKNDKIIYPNPTQNSFKIRNIYTPKSLKIMNIQGILLNEINSNLDGEISISNFPSGIYFILIEDHENHLYSTKLIKQ
jgi:alpha-tubulin suppressor-like RCC1 family protein